MTEEIFEYYTSQTEAAALRLLPESGELYKTVVEAMRYSLLSGGKRIRPLLLGEFYKLFSGSDCGYEYFALAVEMIHTYSLIHDDLPCMDNDDMRRGKPSCHKAYGEATALLAGDALLTDAFYVASLTDGIPSDRVRKAIGMLSYYAGYRGMIGGQVIDLAYENNSATAEILEKIDRLKTGALIKASVMIGAYLAGAGEDDIKKCEEYADALGIAFQITDDILDVTSDAETLGKPVGSDEKNGKSTYVSLLGIDKCRETAAILTNKALSVLSSFDGDTDNLKSVTEYLLKRKK